MILNNNVLDQLLSKEGQQREIERLQKVEVGKVLFLTPAYKNSDVEETLINKAGISYGVRIANNWVYFVRLK